MQGGTCCGPNCYANLQFSLDAGGRLTTHLNGECVTLESGGALSTEPCEAGKPSQAWFYDPATAALSTCTCLRTRIFESNV